MSQSGPVSIVEVIFNGSEIVLSNGARYTIRPEDREKSTHWYAQQRVVVRKTRGQPWPYIIRNADIASVDQVAAQVSSMS